MYISRYLIYVLPAYYLLIVVCTDYLFTNKTVNQFAQFALVLGFMMSMELNPSKKHHTQEAVNWIRKFKNSETLVLYCDRDMLPSLAYHYHPKYFMTIGDRKEYFLMDSLMRKELFYPMSPPTELNHLYAMPIRKILFFEPGKHCNVPDSTINKAVGKNCILYHTEIFGDSHRLKFYLVR